MNACEKCGFNQNRMLIETDQIPLLLKSDSHYYPIKDHEEVERAPAVLNSTDDFLVDFPLESQTSHFNKCLLTKCKSYFKCGKFELNTLILWNDKRL